MIARHQLPAYSPVTVRALLAGAAGALGLEGSSSISQRFRAEWKTRDLLLTSSGTAALMLALRAAVADSGRAVALPAYACYDIATAAIGADVKVLLYDIDPGTLTPQPDSLRRVLAQQPAAIVLLHLFGIPVDVSAIAAFAAGSNTLVIEDAAQAFGAAVRGKPAGTLGSLAVLSFGRGKGFTGGSGGALLVNDDSGLDAVRRLAGDLPSRAGWKQLSAAVAHWILARPLLYRIPASLPFLRLGETIFREPSEPAALSQSSQRMLVESWDASLASADIRKRNADRLRKAVNASGRWNTPLVPVDSDASYLRLPVWSRDVDRARLLTASARRLGVAPSYPLPLARLPGFGERCANANDDFRGAELLAQRLFTLPTHELLSESDLLRLEQWLRGPA